MEPGKDDIIVLLGDVGANFFGGMRDKSVKAMLDMCGPKLLCVHGNHEMRPWNVPGYELKEWHGGKVWVQESFPNLLFAKDGEIFDLDGLRCIVIGGAYSVDKPMRLSRGYGWWEDEQPSDEIKTYVEEQLRTNPIDVVLSHTCPFKYEPIEMFLSGVDQSGVDDSTERWLDKIEESIDYKAWYCGHWHTDKRIYRMHFLFESFEGLERE
jgi:3-oxoacid CoA-transferase subunit A